MWQADVQPTSTIICICQIFYWTELQPRAISEISSQTINFYMLTVIFNKVPMMKISCSIFMDTKYLKKCRGKQMRHADIKPTSTVICTYQIFYKTELQPRAISAISSQTSQAINFYMLTVVFNKVPMMKISWIIFMDTKQF